MYWFVGFLLISSITVTASAQTQSFSTVEPFQAALERFERGDHKGALAAFRDLQQAAPHPALVYNIAALYAQNGKLDQALTELLQALKSDPKATQIARAIGRVAGIKATYALNKAVANDMSRVPAAPPVTLSLLNAREAIFLPQAPAAISRPSIYVPSIAATLRLYHNPFADDAHQSPPASATRMDEESLALASDDYERSLLLAINAQDKDRVIDALELIDQHLRDFPKSRVGWVVKANILGDLSGLPLNNRVLPKSDFALADLTKQIVHRVAHYAPERVAERFNRVPENILDLGEHPFVIVADMQRARLYVYRNTPNGPQYVYDYYLSVGSKGYGKEVEGDLRTPIGVYRITRFIPDQELPDLYGSGAFPVDYPNVFDRARKRTGYGIWLHGTPSSTFARAPWASEGCFVVSNPDFKHIAQYLDVADSTPVVLAEQVNWVEPAARDALARSFAEAFNDWRSSWEQLDADKHLSFYSPTQFDFGRGGFDEWAARRRNATRNKSFIKVDVELDGTFIYPAQNTYSERADTSEGATVVVWFTQDYDSDSYSSRDEKQQYWQQDASGNWKIIYESS